MAYEPQLGNGAQIAFGTTAAPGDFLFATDIEITMEQTAVESTTLVDLYKTFLRGRRGFRITATLAATADASEAQRSVLIGEFIAQITRGNPVYMTITDSGSDAGGTSQTYVSTVIVTSLTQTMRGDEIDTLRIEATGTGVLN